MENNEKLNIQYVEISDLKLSEYNPRKMSESDFEQLKISLNRFGFAEPIVLNSFKDRYMIVIGGHQRIKAARALGIKKIPAVFLNISNLEKEKELNIRLNRNVGEFDWSLLKSFDESFLNNVGFSSEELDKIFDFETPEIFDLEKELKKLKINEIKTKKGDIYSLNDSRLMCGDSTVEEDILKLMNNEKADMCFTDPPYILDYLNGKKKHGKATDGFGLKRDRKYLGTDVLPPDFTQKWMANMSKVQKNDFSIIVYENWKNVPVIWSEMSKHWKIKNMLIWHISNRVQGFAAKYKFFNKYDFALLGTNGDQKINENSEEGLLQNEYETALFAISGKPHWENYEKGKKYNPTDFIEHNASDEKSSGQSIIFGTKPVEILIPYIKILTKRSDLIVEPFSGSGSTLIAATKMKRRCYGMEKSPVYCEVIIKRWENLTHKKVLKVNK